MHIVRLRDWEKGPVGDHLTEAQNELTLMEAALQGEASIHHLADHINAAQRALHAAYRALQQSNSQQTPPGPAVPLGTGRK